MSLPNGMSLEEFKQATTMNLDCPSDLAVLSISIQSNAQEEIAMGMHEIATLSMNMSKWCLCRLIDLTKNNSEY